MSDRETEHSTIMRLNKKIAAQKDEIETLRAAIDAKITICGDKQLSEAQAQIAMLCNLQYELMGIAADVDAGNGFDIVCRQTLRRVIDSLSGAQATALAYEREVKAKVLEEAKSKLKSVADGYNYKTSYGEGRIDSVNLCCDEVDALIRASKGEVK